MNTILTFPGLRGAAAGSPTVTTVAATTPRPLGQDVGKTSARRQSGVGESAERPRGARTSRHLIGAKPPSRHPRNVTYRNNSGERDTVV